MAERSGPAPGFRGGGLNGEDDNEETRLTVQRVLILGGAGMLGHKLVQVFGGEFDTWTTVRGSATEYAPYGLIDSNRVIPGVDALDFDSLTAVIDRVEPQAVINCIGIIKQLPTAFDPVLNLTINSLLPHRLQQVCHARGARLIHFSTDCVFSGRKGAYTRRRSVGCARSLRPYEVPGGDLGSGSTDDPKFGDRP